MWGGVKKNHNFDGINEMQQWTVYAQVAESRFCGFLGYDMEVWDVRQ